MREKIAERPLSQKNDSSSHASVSQQRASLLHERPERGRWGALAAPYAS